MDTGRRYDFHMEWLLTLVCLMLLGYAAVAGYERHRRMMLEGVTVRGVVNDWDDGQHLYHIDYSFAAGARSVHGAAAVHHAMHTGDSVMIRYLPLDPSVNEPLDTVQ
ncbi:MAG: hypothetical protein JST76_07910 [Bacteroidetes bacterium]|nr:hypothetical protein [Bacteroidota bacterium]